MLLARSKGLLKLCYAIVTCKCRRKTLKVATVKGRTAGEHCARSCLLTARKSRRPSGAARPVSGSACDKDMEISAVWTRDMLLPSPPPVCSQSDHLSKALRELNAFRIVDKQFAQTSLNNQGIQTIVTTFGV